MKTIFRILLAGMVVLMATPLCAVAEEAAQAHHQHEEKAPRQQGNLATPFDGLFTMREGVRVIQDLAAVSDFTAVAAEAESLKKAIAYLRTAIRNAEEDLKPEARENLDSSLAQIDGVAAALIEATSAGDKTALDGTVISLKGAMDLLLVDLPPGLVEKLSGFAVRAELVDTPVLSKGIPGKVVLRLKHVKTGKPVMIEQLEVVHTEPIHLLIIEPGLSDYVHAHPVALDAPGEYGFSITPKTDCTYRMWVDIKPAKEKTHMLIIDIPGARSCLTDAVDRTETLSAQIGGYSMNLGFDTPPRAAAPLAFKLSVTDGQGNAVTGFEPVMGAKAHLVGFYEDFRTIQHVHPVNEMSDDLDFSVRPEKSGFLKLYAQIRVGGQDLYFPFGMGVGP